MHLQRQEKVDKGARWGGEEPGGAFWLTEFMNGPIMRHQESGGQENMKEDKK